MPAVFYQVLHVASLLALSGLAYGLIFSNQNKKLKKAYGIFSFLVLLGGFGLMARMGYTFKDQSWMTVKLLIWVLLSVGFPIMIKRTQLSKKALVSFVFILLSLAVYMVYVRPI